MRIYQIINEDEVVMAMPHPDHRLYIGTDPELKKHMDDRGWVVAEYILENCQMFVSHMGGISSEHLMYRGMNTNKPIAANNVAFVRDVRQDRKPKDTRGYLHDLLNIGLAQCGSTANRSNSAFCTGDQNFADEFTPDGNFSPVVFPVGDFSYTWHENFRDWTFAMGLQQGGDDQDWTRYFMITQVEDQGHHMAQEQIQRLKKELDQAINDIQSKARQVGVDLNLRGFAQRQEERSRLYRLYSDLRKLSLDWLLIFGSDQTPPAAADRAEHIIRQQCSSDWADLMVLMYQGYTRLDQGRGQSRSIHDMLIKLTNQVISLATKMAVIEKQVPSDYMNRHLKQLYMQDGTLKNLDVDDLDQNRLAEFCRGLHADDGSLAQAIESGNEIMIHAQKMLYVDHAFFQAHVIKHLVSVINKE